MELQFLVFIVSCITFPYCYHKLLFYIIVFDFLLLLFMLLKVLPVHKTITGLEREKDRVGQGLRRRIELEDKAKVVALDWGTESLPR